MFRLYLRRKWSFVDFDQRSSHGACWVGSRVPTDVSSTMLCLSEVAKGAIMPGGRKVIRLHGASESNGPVPEQRGVDSTFLTQAWDSTAVMGCPYRSSMVMQSFPKHTPAFASSLSAQRDSDPLMQCRASAIHPHLREDLSMSDRSRPINLYKIVREAINNELDLAASSVVCVDRHLHHRLDPKGAFRIARASDGLFDTLQHPQSQIQRLQASHLS